MKHVIITLVVLLLALSIAVIHNVRSNPQNYDAGCTTTHCIFNSN